MEFMPLAAANRAIRDAHAGSDRTRAKRRQTRRGIEAIDAVLAAVEEHHLERHPRNIPLMPAWRRRLAEVGGLSIPQEILGLNNTVRLHAALLDWQDVLLNDVVPGRVSLVEEDERGEGRWTSPASAHALERSAA